MAEVKGMKKARTVAAVLVAFLAVLGLPAQAAFAQDAGFDLNVEAEHSTTGVGGDVTLKASISPSNSTGGPIDVLFEVVEDAPDGDTPATPDGFCTIAPSDDDCTVLFAGVGGGFAGGSTATPGVFTVIGWVDNPTLADCNADRVVCGSPGNEEQNTVGGRAEPDDTDVVTVVVETTTAVTLDCAPDTQSVSLGIAPGDVTCTESNQNGTTTTLFEVDMERIGGPNDLTPGLQEPVDEDGVGTGTFTYLGTTIGSSTSDGVLYLCFFLDTDTSISDTDIDGDCASEVLNPGADDNDGTDVVCIAYGSGTCAGGTPTPTPTGTVPPKVPPVIAGEGCADGEDAASFRIIIGQELVDAFFEGTPVENFISLLQPATELDVGADDPDGGPTTLTLEDQPSWIKLVPETPSSDPVAAKIVGTPSLLDAAALLQSGLETQFTLVATDDEGQKDTCTFTAFVGPNIDLPGPLGAE